MAEIIHAPAISQQRRTLPAGAVPAAPDPVVPAAGQEAATVRDGVSAQDDAQDAARAAAQQAAQARHDAELAAAQARREAEQARLAEEQRLREEAEADERAKIDAVYEDARKRGYDDGHAEGYADGHRQFGEACERLQAVTEELDIAVEGGLADVEDIALEIVYEAICTVLGDALGTREGLLAQVRKVLDKVHTREALTVRLHPQDLELIGQAGVQGARLQGAAVSWVADDSLELGGCVVAGNGGELDARLDTILDSYKRALSAARAAKQASGELA